jgi:hypothetical protein
MLATDVNKFNFRNIQRNKLTELKKNYIQPTVHPNKENSILHTNHNL